MEGAERWQSEHAQAADSAARLESQVQSLTEQLAAALRGHSDVVPLAPVGEAPAAVEAAAVAEEPAPGVGEVIEAMRKAQLEDLAQAAEEWCQSNGAELLEEAIWF